MCKSMHMLLKICCCLKERRRNKRFRVFAGHVFWEQCTINTPPLFIHLGGFIPLLKRSTFNSGISHVLAHKPWHCFAEKCRVFLPSVLPHLLGLCQGSLLRWGQVSFVEKWVWPNVPSNFPDCSPPLVCVDFRLDWKEMGGLDPVLCSYVAAQLRGKVGPLWMCPYCMQYKYSPHYQDWTFDDAQAQKALLCRSAINVSCRWH